MGLKTRILVENPQKTFYYFWILLFIELVLLNYKRKSILKYCLHYDKTYLSHSCQKWVLIFGSISVIEFASEIISFVSRHKNILLRISIRLFTVEPVNKSL